MGNWNCAVRVGENAKSSEPRKLALTPLGGRAKSHNLCQLPICPLAHPPGALSEGTR